MVGKINTGGLNIDGIVEKYRVAAGENVKAGDFVEFVNNEGTDMVGMHICRTAISAVALSEDKVFVAYLTSTDGNYKIHGKICTINGTKINYGLDTVLKSYGNVVQSISVTKLNENKIVISYILDFEGDSLSGLRLDVYNIDGTGISSDMVGFEYANAGTPGYSTLSAVALDENRVFIAFTCRLTSSTPYVLQGVIFKITAEINIGNVTYMGEVNSGGTRKLSAVAINANKVLIACGSQSDALHGIICSIDEMLISMETDTELNEDEASGYAISAVALSDNRVFIAHSGGINEDGIHTNNLYGTLCSVDGVSINVINSVLLNSEIYAGSVISTILVGENKVLIAHSLRLWVLFM